MAKAAKPAPRKTAAKTANGGKSPDEKAPSISEGKAPGAVNLQVPPPQPGTQPSMRILGQYLKDLSFENPNAPQALETYLTVSGINARTSLTLDEREVVFERREIALDRRLARPELLGELLDAIRVGRVGEQPQQRPLPDQLLRIRPPLRCEAKLLSGYDDDRHFRL